MIDWSSRIPPWTSQYSVPNRFDAWDCVAESLINIVYMITGFDGSPRALAKLSNTAVGVGNSLTAVQQAANEYGLIPYELWPTPDTFDQATYYADIPPEILAKAIKVKLDWQPASLDISPLWTILKFPSGVQHAVAQLNDTQYFDSEQGDEIKPLNYAGATVLSQGSLKVQIINDPHIMKLYIDKRTTPPTIIAGLEIDDPKNLVWYAAQTGFVLPMKPDMTPDFDKLNYDGEINNVQP